MSETRTIHAETAGPGMTALRQVSTFTTVGVVATLTHLGVAWVAHRIGASPHMANFTGWLIALFVSFLGQARLTFRVDGALFGYFPRFLTLSVLAYLVSALVIALTIHAGSPFWIGLTLVALVVPPASYLAQRFLVFSTDARKSLDAGNVLAVATGFAIFFGFQDAYVNHDVAWYLVAGRQWMEGARLYADLSEVNPPLAFYLVRGALHLGDALSLDPAASLAAWIALLTTFSLIWSARHVPGDLPHRSAFLTALAAATILPFLGHFGQREHFMLLLILPWVTSAIFQEDAFEGRGALARGMIAGVGICLKPHFLIYPALLVLLEMLRRKSLRPLWSPGNLAMGSVGVAYVVGVAILHSEYFTIIVPDARLVYGAYTLPLVYVFENLWPWQVSFAAVVLAVGYRSAGLGGTRALVLFLAGLGAYALQGNGFTYHAAPAHGLAVIALALVATQAPHRVALAAAGAITIYAQAFISEGGYRNPLSSPLEAQLTSLELAPERLLVWSPSLLPAFPLVLETQAEWTGPAASLWLLPGTLDLVEHGGSDDDPRRAVLARSQEQMARGLARCPDVLIVDRVLPFRAKPLDVLAYAGPETEKAVRENYKRALRDIRFDILVRHSPCF